MFEKGVKHAHIHQFGNNRQVMFVGSLAEYAQAIHAFSLKSVRAGAWFESAAAHQSATGRRHLLRGQIHLFLCLHGAGAANHLHLVATDRDAAHIDD